MNIQGLKKEIIDVEVEDSVIVDSFLQIVKRKLPKQIRHLDLFVENGELFYWEETIGHNRDFEQTKVKNVYPDLIISDEIIKIVTFHDMVKKYKE